MKLKMLLTFALAWPLAAAVAAGKSDLPAKLTCETIVGQLGAGVGKTPAKDEDALKFVMAASEQMADRMIDAIYGFDGQLDTQAVELLAQEAMEALGAQSDRDETRFNHTIEQLSRRGTALQTTLAETAALTLTLSSIEVEAAPRGIFGKTKKLMRDGASYVPVLGKRVEKVVVNKMNVATVFKELRAGIKTKAAEIKEALLTNLDDIVDWHQEADYYQLQGRAFGRMAEKLEQEIAALEQEDPKSNAPQISALRIYARNLRDRQVASQDLETLKLKGSQTAILAGDELLAVRSTLETKAPALLKQIEMNVATGTIVGVANSTQEFSNQLTQIAGQSEVELATLMRDTAKKLVAQRDGTQWQKLMDEADKIRNEAIAILAGDVEKRDRERTKVLSDNERRIGALRDQIDPAVYARTNSREMLEPSFNPPVGTGRKRLTARAGESAPVHVDPPAPAENTRLSRRQLVNNLEAVTDVDFSSPDDEATPPAKRTAPRRPRKPKGPEAG